MDKVLGIFQIGPVQEFISRSRKTQDFWASSFLLSYLISKAIEKVIEKGGKLIYPYTNTENLSSLLQNTCTPIIPNRFVVELDKERAFEALQEAEKSVKTEFLNIANTIKKSIKIYSIPNSTSYIDKIFQRQIERFFEIYWIIYPLDNNYANSYKKAEIIFSGRKSIRDFSQIDEPGFKCTLCGEREALSDKEKASREEIRESWSKLRKLHKYEFKEKEHLCAICTIKRLYPKYIKVCNESDIGVPSTATIAVSPFLERLIENYKKGNIEKEKIENFLRGLNEIENILDEGIEGRLLKKIRKEIDNIDILKKLNIDGTYFLKETYDNLSIDHPKIKDKAEDIKNILGEFYIKFKEPSKYFAVIQVDGDNIGEEISNLTSINEHREFSNKILNFSQEVLNVEDKFLSKVIYFGGDEGVIFAPLRDLLNIIEFIHELFFNNVSSNGKPTLSFGIAIAHYSHALQKVIEESRESLKRAKKIDGKYSLGFSLLKRSGETVVVAIKYKFDHIYTIDFMKKIKALYEKDEISKRWWKDLYDDRLSFIGRDQELLKDIFISEVKRYFLRRVDKSIDPKPILKDIENFIRIIPIYNGFDIFMGIMEIIEFIYREE